jgi:TBC1 domain family member 8/9
MATINTQFRNFKEPTKDQLLRNYFSLPPLPTLDASGSEKDGSLPVDRVEINAVCIF